MLVIEFLSLSANTYLDLGLARNPNIQSLPRTPNLLGTMHKISLDTTGVMSERVQRVHFHPSIFANGCIAPVLIDNHPFKGLILPFSPILRNSWRLPWIQFSSLHLGHKIDINNGHMQMNL